MLYVFHGDNLKLSIEKAHTLIDQLLAKRPEAAFEKMSAENWNAAALESHLGGQGLFLNKYIVFLDRLSENTEAREKLLEFIPVLKESANIFIVLEGLLNAEFRKTLETYAEKAVASDMEKPKKSWGTSGAKGDFNIFALADALGNRDARRSWTLYRQAVDNGQESEAIIGTLFWQVKSMMLAAQAKSAAEAGLSPFVFSKSKRYAGNYSAAELRQLSKDLIRLYHEGHRGACDLELAMERLILALK